MTTHQTQPSLRSPIGEDSSGLLRLALKLDAVASGALGALSLVTGTVLDDLLGTPLALLVPVGLFLLAYATFVWVVGTRRRINRTVVWVVISLNLVWVADSVAVVLAKWLPLTGLGVAFVLAQAAAVALFAELQFLGLRRARRGTGFAGPSRT